MQTRWSVLHLILYTVANQIELWKTEYFYPSVCWIKGIVCMLWKLSPRWYLISPTISNKVRDLFGIRETTSFHISTNCFMLINDLSCKCACKSRLQITSGEYDLSNQSLGHSFLQCLFRWSAHSWKVQSIHPVLLAAFAGMQSLEASVLLPRWWFYQNALTATRRLSLALFTLAS